MWILDKCDSYTMVDCLVLAAKHRQHDTKAIVTFISHIHHVNDGTLDLEKINRIPTLTPPTSCGSDDASVCLHCMRCQGRLVYSSLDQRGTRNAVTQAQQVDDARTIHPRVYLATFFTIRSGLWY